MMEKMFQSFLANALVIFTLISLIFHSSYSNPTGFSIKIIPRDSPESPLYPGNLTRTQRIERMVRFTLGRAQYLKTATSDLNDNTTSNSSSVVTPQDAIMPLYRERFFYVAQILLGTPPLLLYLLMDTGGNPVWTQCLPCESCYKQTAPVYSPRESSSYRKLPCSHFLCNSPQGPYRCVDNQCVYRAQYGTGSSSTEGIASVETIRFMLSSGALQAIDGIIFGCSKKNLNFPFYDTPISGIMGLSWAPDSLMTQLAPFTNRRFSYCLVPFHEDRPGPSTLTFGDAIPAPHGNVLTTNFVSPPGTRNYYFYLNLLDISVGWKRLGFPPGTFGVNQDGSGGFFIDSGAPFSLLVNEDLPNGRNPYKEVLSAFQNYYDSKGLKRKDIYSLELCYELPNGFNAFATMTYHFQGADHIVDGRFVNYINTEDFCIGLMPGPKLSILGAVHQQNTRFIYDGSIFSLRFVSEVCN